MRLKVTGLTLLLALACLTAVGTGSAEEPLTVGFRGGFSEKEVSGKNFQQYEFFVDYPLPWNWQWSGGWQLDTRVSGTAGILYGGGKTGFVGSVGPALSFSQADVPLSLELGSSPTLLSRSQFEGADFGTKFQFTSHLGIHFQPNRELELGYRFQHMSNAGIEKPNPGLNLHMFELGYRF